MTMICCIVNCKSVDAQTGLDKVQVLEKLDDGSFVLTINGEKYRAITPEQIRQIQAVKINFQACVDTNNNLSDKNLKLQLAFQQAKQDAAVGNAQTLNAKMRGDEFKQMYEDERNLRLSAEKLPKQKNLFEKILNHPVTQIITVVVTGTIAARQVHN